MTAEEWIAANDPKVVMIQRAVRRWLRARSVLKAEQALLDAIRLGDLDGENGNGDGEAQKEHKETEKEAYQR